MSSWPRHITITDNDGDALRVTAYPKDINNYTVYAQHGTDQGPVTGLTLAHTLALRDWLNGHFPPGEQKVPPGIVYSD